MNNDLTLRPLIDADLALFFVYQQDRQAAWMAAFTAKDPDDRAAFLEHWAKIRADPGITIRTILVGGQVAGHISCHSWFGEPELTYWVGREHWGRGVATRALSLFLEIVAVRPLYARVAHDNLASRRVLEKCGFIVCGEDRGFANARGAEVAELVLRLDSP